MKRTGKDRQTQEPPAAAESSETCKYKKGQKFHLGEKEVETLIKSLESRGPASRTPEAAAAPPPAAPAEPVAMAKDITASGASGERMSDEDLEELSLVLKMTRSATNARQCGLRILEETRRAREAEAGLLKEGVPAAKTVRRFPAA